MAMLLTIAGILLIMIGIAANLTSGTMFGTIIGVLCLIGLISLGIAWISPFLWVICPKLARFI